METIENLIIETTTACNLRCIHCGYKLISSHNIDTALVIDIIEKLIEYGLKMVMFTGGEPTLNKDLLFIARFCKQKDLRVKIASNGSFLDPINALLKENIIDELVISVDAIYSQTYLQIRGRDVLKSIYQFIEQNQQYSNRIHLSFLIQKSNYNELIPFLEKAKALNIAKVSLLVPHYDMDFTTLVNSDDYRNMLYLSNADILKFQQSIVPALRNFYLNNHRLFTCSINHIEALINYICAPDFNHNFRNSVCSFPLKSLFLYSDGRLALCPYSYNWSIDLTSFLVDIKKVRMKCKLEGKEKNSYCRRCLEVPL